MRYLLVLLMVLAGIGVAVQAATNARMGAAAQNPLAGALVNFCVGLIALGLVMGLGIFGRPQLHGLGQAPGWAWIGGLIGATYVTATIIVVPKIGASITFTALMCGQLIGAMVLDTFGWLEVPQIPLSPWRVIGAVCLVLGVILMQWK